MRIIAGQWRGRKLAHLGKGDEAARLRPTPDRVRESLFSMLAAQGVLEGAEVLDLFAGTGALALEALSRGAAQATLVENGRTGQRLIRENIETLNAQAKLLGADATRLPACTGSPADLIFLDPPYGKGLGPRTLAAAVRGGWCTPGATVVWEEENVQQAPEGFVFETERRFGAAHLTFLRFDG